MRFTIYQDSAIGARNTNQDRMGYCFSREALLAVVADGMGGHMRGEVAAQLAMQAAAAMFQKWAQPRLRDPAGFLDEALRAGHRELHRYRELHEMPECPRFIALEAQARNLALPVPEGNEPLPHDEKS